MTAARDAEAKRPRTTTSRGDRRLERERLRTLQLVLPLQDWLASPETTQAVRQHLLRSPCESCPERDVAGARRSALLVLLRKEGRTDYQRAVTGRCSVPCGELERWFPAGTLCDKCSHRSICRTPCHLVDRQIPRNDPLYFDEISTDPMTIAVRSTKETETVDPSRWRWADIADDVRKDLRAAIDEVLSIKQKTAILYQLDGLSGVETARRMGVTKVTVHHYCKRAKRRIRDYFAARPKLHGRLLRGSCASTTRSMREAFRLHIANPRASANTHPRQLTPGPSVR